MRETAISKSAGHINNGSFPKAYTNHYLFCLFGQFQFRTSSGEWATVNGRKIQEVLAYLLLFRRRAHQRELLAGTLWGGSTTAQSKKYLRQSIWELRKTVVPTQGRHSTLLVVEPNWIRVNEACLWLDVAEFEESWTPLQKVRGEEMTDEQSASVRSAVALYRADLLEGWYQDWCVYERERLRAAYLSMLEKLLAFSEVKGKPEEGLAYGDILLREEPAHERAHWRLMRLHYLAGDRTRALRQYEKCQAALGDELGIAPGKRTRQLYEEIRADDVISLEQQQQVSVYAGN
jgi:DNA-binding SARP family transcriptional activator